jgi:hypothetical protein
MEATMGHVNWSSLRALPRGIRIFFAHEANHWKSDGARSRLALFFSSDRQ